MYQSCCFEKFNETDKPLARFMNQKRTQISKIRNEREDITTDFAKIKRTINEYYEQLHANKVDNLDEMDKFLETHNLPKMNQDKIENLN